MNADQLKQHIYMLRNQRAGIQAKLARRHVERHNILTNLDKDIAACASIVLDLDVQIAEEIQKYMKMASTPRTPFDECGPGTQSIIRSTIAAGPDGWSPKREEARARCERMAQNGYLIQVVNKDGPDSFLVVPKYVPPAEPHTACRIEP